MRWIRKARATLHDHKAGRLRAAGWRVVAGVVAFYLVRDLLLYVALPALAWAVAAR